jgi:hypothetical protein
METIYGDASNINITSQKRTLRVLYGQTQLTPYAVTLDQSAWRDVNGNFQIPTTTNQPAGYYRSANVFTYLGSVVPGTVLVKTTDENVTVAGFTSGTTGTPTEPTGAVTQLSAAGINSFSGTSGYQDATGFETTVNANFSGTAAGNFTILVGPSISAGGGDTIVTSGTVATATTVGYEFVLPANWYARVIATNALVTAVTQTQNEPSFGSQVAQQPFGLLGSWLGGTFGQLTQVNQIQAWRGPDGLIELLAPAWNDTGLAAAVSATGTGIPVYLYAQADGRLGITDNGNQIPVAFVVSRPTSARLLINLLI